MDELDTTSYHRPDESVIPRPHRLLRRLSWLYGGATVAVVLLLAMAALPPAVMPQARALAHEALVNGLGAMVLTALLLALTALSAALSLTAARYRYGIAAPAAFSARVRWSLADPGFAARQLQAFIVPVGALLVWLAAQLLWPTAHAEQQAAAGNVAAAFVFALAFVSLIAERLMHDFPAPQLPEAPALRRLLLLVTVLLAAAALVQIGHSARLSWMRWPAMVIIVVPCLVALELALRALARLFVPAPAAAGAKAVSDSLLVGLLTGGPRAPGTLLRTHFGLDFARSWALSFLSAAVLPALLGTALLCWALSGLKLIDLGHRGVYERFGAPVAVYGPGLHLLLPWPMGRLRLVDYGTIHSVPIGVDQTTQQNLPAEPMVGAEAVAPLSLNRLWESVHADQAHYLVASEGTGEQGFQSVDTEIFVLYRIGLTDAAARESVYTLADPQALIRETASSLVLRYFNSRTLEEVIGARRQNIAGMLRDELAVDIASYHAGVDIVSVLIEEIHPPVGAAQAYHEVQAARINASASISDELGRARRTAGVAQQEAHQLVAAATAQAVETRDVAASQAYRFDIDRRAYAADGRPFLLERLYGNLSAALRGKRLTIMDHRLSAGDGPIIDMRPAGAQAAGAVTPSLPNNNAPPIPASDTDEPAFTNAD
ncbi:MAG TPA: SPFH domain-containing protein [Steroidobacteraceae bacterium]|jgi:regulator of protease activity HflC (stomatin/prohibitin superfamily)|nr:SPFH domain-containing protein [Steroidobacteraceae bacterium]